MKSATTHARSERSRQNSAQALRRRGRVLERFGEIHRYVKRWACSFDVELRMLSTLYETDDYKKLRHLDATWIDGWRSCMRHHREQHELVHHVAWRGYLVPSNAVLKGTWHEAFGGATMWAHNPERMYSIDLKTYDAFATMHGYPAMEDAG